LERRHNTFGGGAVSAADAAAAAKAAAAELSLVLGFLSQRGWADLSVPNSSGMDAGAQQELDEQLDEVSSIRQSFSHLVALPHTTQAIAASRTYACTFAAWSA
jgi:hypothetical protein